MVEDSDGTRDLWIASVDGQGPRRVYDCSRPCAWSDDPAWAPDGRSLLFQEGRAVGDAGLGAGLLRRLSIESGDVETLYTAPDTVYLYVPRWAPDGTRAVVEAVRFASARLDEERVTEGTIGLVAFGVAPASFAPLLPWDTGAGYPDWQPGGDLVVHQRPAGGGSDIWVVALDGTRSRRLTTLADVGGRALQPTWAPQGDRVVFVAERSIGTPRGAFLSTTGGEIQWVPGDHAMTHPRLRPVP